MSDTRDDTGRFDWDGFCYDLNSVRLKRRMSWKDVALQSRVNASSLTRLQQGKDLSVENLTRLLVWAGLSFDTYAYMVHVHFA